MTSWFGFLAAAVGPLALRVMAALGFSVVTFVGLDATLDALLDVVRNSIGGTSGKVLAIVTMAGMLDAVNIIASCLTARVAIALAGGRSRWVFGGA